MADAARPTPQALLVPARQPWNLPRLAELPKLTDLTLASVIGGGGGTGGGGSTVFTLLLAVLSLAVLPSCSSDRSMEPSGPTTPAPVAAVTCTGNVSSLEVSCTGPQSAPGEVILGGQGIRVTLRSSNVLYTPADSSFTFLVSVQNVSGQTIGHNGTTTTGIRVFFQDLPTPLTGSGSILIENDSTGGTFTGVGQHYYKYALALSPTQTSGAQPWQFHIEPEVLTFTFTVLVAADVADDEAPLGWRTVDGLSYGWWAAAAARSPNDMMAVSSGGRTARWNGSAWVDLVPVGDESFTAVATAGPSEYVAVGQGGRVYVSKGNTWTQLHFNSSIYYTAVWAEDADHITAVGGYWITTCVNGVCTDVDVDVTAGLAWVAGSPDGNYRVAMGNGIFYESDAGGPWSSAIDAVDPGDYVTGMTIDQDGDLIIATADQFTTAKAVIRYPAEVLYATTDSAFVALSAVGDDTVAVVLYDWVSDASSILLLGYDGEEFADIVTGVQSMPEDPRGIAAIDGANTQFLLFGGPNAFLTRWTGSAFIRQEPTEPDGAVDLATIGDTLYLVNGTADLWQVVGGTAVKLSPGLGGLKQIAAYGSGTTAQMMVVTNGNALYRRTGSTWTYEHTMDGASSIIDLAVDPATDTWFAAGTGAGLAIFLGGVWFDSSDDPSFDYTAVWNCDTYFYLTTAQGYLLRYDPAVGMDGDPEFPAVFGSGALGSITGTSCSDIWITKSTGALWHWDGSFWFDLGPFVPGRTPYASVARGPGEAYIGGNDGSLMLALAGAAPVTLRFTAGVDRHLQWMARTANGTIYAAGPGFLARTTD